MKTLRDKIVIKGIGLHSGKSSTLTISPYNKSGIFFSNKNGISRINEAEIREDSRLTGFSLPNGMIVRTGEHLLGALAGMEVDSALLELTDNEVPILDGSALPFVEAIASVGLVEIDGTPMRSTITQPYFVEENDGKRIIAAFPCDKLRVSYIIDYSGTPIGVQKVKYDINADVFYNVICRARTFALTRELEYLKENNLAKGGSLENAMLFDGNGLVGGVKPRLENECVTHKVIDLLGDLTLIGSIPVAHYVAIAAGHSIHGKLVSLIKRDLRK